MKNKVINTDSPDNKSVSFHPLRIIHGTVDQVVTKLNEFQKVSGVNGV